MNLISIICLVLPIALGFLSGSFTAENIPSWYVHLNKPSFNPPNYLFAPVWTVLYILMGYGWGRVQKINPRAWLFFAPQMILNMSWSWVFFVQHQIGWALVNIAALWISILVMLLFFARQDRLAGYLQIPYLLWVSFATVLNAAIWQLN